MNILCIETSIATGSVALQQGEHVLESYIETPRTHAEQLIPRIESLLNESGIAPAQLDAIAFGRGPGSFIGVRLAAAVAQGLAVGAAVGLAPISSMAALACRGAEAAAHTLDDGSSLFVCLDARMDEVYCAAYEWRQGRIESSGPEQLLRPDAVKLPSRRQWLALGSGFAAFPELQALALQNGAVVHTQLEPRARELLPFARSMIRNDQLVAGDAWRSEYLRTHSAWQSLK
jgi:tRNA threonylcarbamoyladenosine biosynthesis protein TsaB